MAHYKKPSLGPQNYNNFGPQGKKAYNGTSRNRSAQKGPSRLEVARKTDEIDRMMGFERFESGPARTGWLVNFHQTVIQEDLDSLGTPQAACDFYFLDQEGGLFKTTVIYEPYFFLVCQNGMELEVEDSLKKTLEGLVKRVERVEKEDLSLPNHLIGLKRTLLKLSFRSLQELNESRRVLRPLIEKNQAEREARDVYLAVNSDYIDEDARNRKADALEYIYDMKEHDVPFHVRVAIDWNLRVGKWYNVSADNGTILFKELDIVAPADPVILAFDIETTKAPLKFPDAAVDQVMMISYMVDGEGYLITNREIISADIDDFEYTPKPEYPGTFTVFNEPDEVSLLNRFFDHIREVRPTVIATFNGDFFDWPFVDARASVHGLSLYDEIGFAKDSENEYKLLYCCHMDCFRWVKRDSYLPQGSQGLKAVTTVKLGYNPIELDPELMTPYALEKPQVLSEYSVSDAVATYYLYYNYVHPFIFSLATIIPLNGDETLRKGTGTLCEMLLMVQAYENGILLPNKHTDPLERFYDGHLLESETYVGGHVESLEAGVFRSDLELDFKVDPSVIDELLPGVPEVVKFFVQVECFKNPDNIENLDSVVSQILEQLLDLKNRPKRKELPLIYHVDVALMYPNIMILNRLQPDLMKTEQDCAACDFNHPGKRCDRPLTWAWRGEYFPAKMDEYGMVRKAMGNELFDTKYGKKPFDDLPYPEQVSHLKKRILDYSRKVYHRIKASETVEKTAIVCQRENPFYINTVRSFRDRRYTYKGLAKKWKKKMGSLNDPYALDEAKKMVITYDSLQLAHKVILNSFYGYVMRKGSRWYLMEMAGITCLTGATIIQMARALIERFGRPLELDTDGIWCIIPQLFPDVFDIKMTDGLVLQLPYLCSMLNHLVHQKFTNHNYQELIPGTKTQYTIRLENLIFFELDGPYKAMILPTLKEEGKGLKKRYAVFNPDGSLAELKGFELKRRGELEIVKNMQSDLFPAFLEGSSLDLCYAAVAGVASKWLDVLILKGRNLEDEDLLNLVGEKKSMSKALSEYAGQKLASITTVRRLVEFLGIDTSGDSGITARFIIADRPKSAPIASRAIPIAIFLADITQKRHHLRRWLGDSSLEDFDPRAILDWDYYFERLASVVLKIISIPAYLQTGKNPCPEVVLPAWITRQIQQKSSTQTTLSGFVKKAAKAHIAEKDLEDLAQGVQARKEGRFGRVRKRKTQAVERPDDEAILAAGCPDPTEDYQGWLIYNQAVWRADDRRKEAARQVFGDSAPKSGVTGMISRKNAARDQSWSVLGYEPGNSPGEVRIRALVDGRVRDIKVRVPRRVYLAGDVQNAPKNMIITPLKKTVLGLEKPLFLATMPETVFQEQIKKPGSILRSCEVFEAGVSPFQRALLDLGLRVRYSANELGGVYKGFQHGFDANDLSPEPLDLYLRPLGLDIVFCLHTVLNRYEVYTVFSLWSLKVSVFILKPLDRAQDLLDYSTFEELYLNSLASKTSEIHSPHWDVPQNVSVNLSHLALFSGVVRKVNLCLASLYEERPGTVLVALQTPFASRLMKTVSALAQVPVLQLAHAPPSLPALNWLNALCTKIVQDYLGLQATLDRQIELARYANVPLCHVDASRPGPLLDTLLGRKLEVLGCALWWGMRSPALEPLVFPGINKPDCVETTTVELAVHNLAVNAVLTSGLINEDLGEDGLSQNALSALRAMLRELWDDAVKGASHAELLVGGFVPWMQATGLNLYLRALEHHVHGLLKRVVLQMVQELRKMGSVAVHVLRDRIFVRTLKRSIENCYAYAQYIVKAVRSKPLFGYLDLRVERFWDTLLWMDEYNYAGQYLPADASEFLSTHLEAYLRWQISDFLPPIYQGEFSDWVGLFLEGIVKSRSNEGEAEVNKIEEIKNDDEEIKPDAEGKPLHLIYEPLKKRVRKLYSKQNSLILSEAYKSEYEFPVLAGLHLKMGNPTLELVKSLCAVFALSKKHNLEARALRKELLSLLDVREFSEESIFKNPSMSLRVPGVFCGGCGSVRDLDFCRDDDIWNCPCGTEYNKVGLEEALVAEFLRTVASFYSQDLKCNRCGKIREDELSAYCVCSGEFEGVESRVSLLRRAQVYENVAKYYGLRLLEECIGEV